MEKRGSVTLAELKGGALEELFQRELGLLLENVRDPNTAASKRTITIKFSAKPTGDRAGIELDVTVESKLAGAAPIRTLLIVHDEDGHPVGSEPSQSRLWNDPTSN